MIRRLKQFYVSLCNWIVSFIPPNDFDDVLILRLDQLGDFVLWLDSAKEYRKLYHGKRLTLLVNANWYDFAKSLPYWDEVIPLDTIKFRINPVYRIKFLIFIRQKGFEIAICPRHSVKLTLEPPIVAISGAQQKIVCEGSFPIEKQNYFTRSIPMYPERHELSRNAEFLRGLGRKDFKSTVPDLTIQCPQIPRNKLTKNVVICPTSFRKRKEWGIDNYLQLIDLIRHEFGVQISICGDKEIYLSEQKGVFNTTGKTQIISFINRINNATLVISNDSAAIHLSAALNVPCICIGSENYGRFVPYEIEKTREGMVLPRLIYKPNVKDITVNEVWDIVKDALSI